MSADIRPHYLHTLYEMLVDTALSDLTTAELIALIEVLIPAHSRALEARIAHRPTRPPGKVLTLIPSNGGDAAGESHPACSSARHPAGWRADLLLALACVAS